MFSKKRFFVPAVLVFTSFLGVSGANAQICFSLASLQGSYAFIGNYGSNIAIAFGTRYLDGNGNLTGAAIINEPTAGSTTGARTIATATQAGTYTVNCDGTGQFNRVLTAADGTKTNQVDDFIITGEIVQDGQLIATTIVDAQQVPSAIVQGGVFLTRVHTRQPDVRSAPSETPSSNAKSAKTGLTVKN
jgi:hypothetical protein